MIVDGSALIAILRQKPEAMEFSLALEAASEARMSVVNYVEAGVVADGSRDPMISREYDDLVRLGRIEIVAVTPEQGRLAREAYRDFGRGSGHAAKLNFGDCFAYALAKERDEPLLFKGNDFSATDVRRAGADSTG
jgi:ribonuclease VapC